MDDLVECPADVASVRTARLFVVDKLQEWGCDDLVDSAALLTSELATNAVLHTRQPFSVGVRRVAGRIRVEVLDASEERPRLPAHLAAARTNVAAGDVLALDDDRERLFTGLGMVDAVATEWGTQVIPGRGKVVWFELRADTGNPVTGLGALRHLDDDPADLPPDLPPLVAEGLDDAEPFTWARVLVVVVLLGILAAVVYAGLWAGGVLGEVWYGH